MGDVAACFGCSGTGRVVTTRHDGADFDQKVADEARIAQLGYLEPSVYVFGFTCRGCEESLFRAHLQKRGVCPGCGKVNEEAMAKGWGAARSLHSASCFDILLEREAKNSRKPADGSPVGGTS